MLINVTRVLYLFVPMVSMATRYSLRVNMIRAHVADGKHIDPSTVSLNAFTSSHRSDGADLAARSGQWGKQRRWKTTVGAGDDLGDDM